jgi:hypothetical protein
MREPPRLRDGGEDLLAATLLDAARAYRRPTSTRNSILKMLGFPIALTVGAPAAAAVASSLATKIIVLVSVTTVVAGGGAVAYQVHARHEANRARTAKAAIVAAARSRGAPQSAPMATPAKAAEPPAEAPLEGPPALAPETPAPPASAAPPAPRAPRRRRAPPAAARPAAPIPPVAMAPTTAQLPNTAPEGVSFPAPQSAPTPASPAPPPVATRPRPADVLPLPSAAPPAPPLRAPLAGEIALLDAAERAERRRDHHGALASLNEYAHAYPDGALLAEAQVLRIGALLGTGDQAAAQREARSFFARYAPSPLAARVHSLLSNKSGHEKEIP